MSSDDADDESPDHDRRFDDMSVTAEDATTADEATEPDDDAATSDEDIDAWEWNDLAAAAFATVDIRLGFLLGVYPLFVTWVARSAVSVDRAYWWFPALNTAVGTLLAMGGLWRVYPVWTVIG